MNWLACSEKEANVKAEALTHAQSACFINAHSQPLAHIFNDDIKHVSMKQLATYFNCTIRCISEKKGSKSFYRSEIDREECLTYTAESVLISC